MQHYTPPACVVAYESEFTRCYPGKPLKIRRNGAGYHVYIDGQNGDTTLSDHDMWEAVKNFQQGRPVKNLPATA